MDRATLEKDLAQAERHIAQGQKQIAVQRRIIAALEGDAYDTVIARELLATSEKKQAIAVAERDRIADELAALD